LPRQNRKTILAPPLRLTCQNVQLQFEAQHRGLRNLFLNFGQKWAQMVEAKADIAKNNPRKPGSAFLGNPKEQVSSGPVDRSPASAGPLCFSLRAGGTGRE